MNEEAVKYLALGGAVLILVVALAGRGRRPGPDVSATLESMRISSETNIAYAQAGVESARIQADLSAQKDRNRSSVQIAGIENETVRMGVRERANNERIAIATDRAMFQEGLRHELGMSYREEAMRRMELGHQLRLGNQQTRRETLIERIRAKAIGDAAARGVGVQFGQQALDRQALEYGFINQLTSQVPTLVDAFGRGWQMVSNAFGYSPQPQASTQIQPLPRGIPNTGYPGGVTTYALPDERMPVFERMDEGPSGSQIGQNVAAGAATGAAVGGPYGAAVGAAAGAGSSFS